LNNCFGDVGCDAAKHVLQLQTNAALATWTNVVFGFVRIAELNRFFLLASAANVDIEPKATDAAKLTNVRFSCRLQAFQNSH
jgi:hypothetical protein